ncbi:hypothetical protein VUR80DRAFT_2958 [Thermomyces stellatus]
MPTYLCHGFRWHRKNIRIFAAQHDIDDAAPEWIIAPASRRGILSTMRELYDFLPPPPPGPSSEPEAPPSERPAPGRRRKGGERYASLALLEEYDPEDLRTLNSPYAYVADHVVRVDLSAGVAAEIAAYEAGMKESGSMSGAASDEYGRKKGTKGWFERLRGELEAEEEIRWYVVVCGDEKRDAGGGSESEEWEGGGGGSESGDEEDGDEEEDASPIPSASNDNQARPPLDTTRTAPEKRRGLRRFLSDLSISGKAGNTSGK